jgi:hypothetical protein
MLIYWWKETENLLYVHCNGQRANNVTQKLIVNKLLFLTTNAYFRFFQFHKQANF